MLRMSSNDRVESRPADASPVMRIDCDNICLPAFSRDVLELGDREGEEDGAVRWEDGADRWEDGAVGWEDGAVRWEYGADRWVEEFVEEGLAERELINGWFAEEGFVEGWFAGGGFAERELTEERFEAEERGIKGGGTGGRGGMPTKEVRVVLLP